MASFLQKHRVADGAAKVRGDAASGRRPRIAAYHFLRGIDHGLSFVVGGLKKFESRKVAGLLADGEERRSVPRKRKLPFEVPAGIKQTESCVVHEATKRSRHDIPDDLVADMSPPSLALFGDEGPRDLPAFWFLPSQGFRVLPQMDVLHRCPRDLKEAAKESGNWAMILDTTAVLNYDHGPFLSEANFHKSLEAVKEYVLMADPQDELFLRIFEPLCRSRGDVPPDFGSVEHCARVFQQLPFADCFRHMSEKVKWTRWGSHLWALVDFRPNRHAKLLALTALGISLGALSDQSVAGSMELAPGALRADPDQKNPTLVVGASVASSSALSASAMPTQSSARSVASGPGGGDEHRPELAQDGRGQEEVGWQTVAGHGRLEERVPERTRCDRQGVV